MGMDKAFLELSGRSLLSNALQLAETVASEVRISGDPNKFAPFGQVVQDIHPGCGPLGGIHAALASSDSELNLILGVDLPLVGTDLLKFLVGIAGGCDAVVTVPRVRGKYEPLCAVYRKSFAEIANAALAAGRNKIDALFPGVGIRVVGDEELERNGFSSSMFCNVNTPEDWKQVQEDFAKRAADL
jgi:molybdenum cofactor guanylyltransferase